MDKQRLRIKGYLEIKGYDNYFINKKGDVVSVKIMIPAKPRGYFQIKMTRSVDQKRVYKYVHHLVLDTFVGIRSEEKNECRHLDGNRLNNHLKNLEWGTRSDNMIDVVKHKRHRLLKLSPNKVRKIRNLKRSMTYAALARRFNVHPKSIQLIIKNKTWKWVKTSSVATR